MNNQKRYTSRSVLAVTALAAALACAACDKEDEAHAESNATGGAAAPAKAPDLASVNNAVPEALRSSLSFAVATVEDGELEAVVPTGWVESEYIPGKFTPPDGSDLGILTRYDVGSNCDGLCSPKDWNATVEKAEFAKFADAARFKVVKDEELPGGRIVVATSDRGTRILAAWWKADASKYYVCRASLDGGAATALQAFENACRATRVLAW